MGEKNFELWKLEWDAQSRYVYFLMAAAGACIAFAIQRTIGNSLHWQLLIWGGAVLCWSVSFVAGCANRILNRRALNTVFQQWRIRAGEDPVSGTDETLQQEQLRKIKAELPGRARWLERWSDWQQYTLAAGAILFVLWHVLEMVTLNGG